MSTENDTNNVAKVSFHFERAILQGELQPGDRLPSERVISAEMNVSRSVVREAMLRLESLGLICKNRRAAARVLAPHSSPIRAAYERSTRQWAWQLKDLYEVRSILEPEIAAAASLQRTSAHLDELERMQSIIADYGCLEEARRSADLRFHALLAEATGNAVFTVALAPLLEILKELSQVPRPRWPQQTYSAHAKILDAVRRRDSVAAREAMREHLKYGQARLSELPSTSGSQQ